ncbi:sugar phosphate isomerase/epimerase [Haloferula luteola]|uniref:Sugar phosphate isomerase/epimerase n=1 Tax=Haloferula luteola TaxID=595692 RepID=A0A840VAT2_9BACT|nr:sugar phosphate isomerase/epimerase [Haloferula luteola]MBB5351050.1 sugar phosphate isomerase/epimerase [Haloferula luteola]
MKRRNALKLLPASSLLFATRGAAAVLPPVSVTPAGYAISVQCWTFKEFTLFEAIEMAAAAGATGVELFPGQKIGGDFGDAGLDPAKASEQVPAVLAKCKEHGIAPVNFGVTDVPNDEAQARVLFDFAKQLGLYGITTEALGSLDVLEKLAKEYDINVCFHNHPKPTALWNPETVGKAIEGRDEHLGYCADIGHWASSGMDPLEVVKSIAPRIRSFHFKDRESITEWTHDRPYGTGILKLPEILAEAKKHGFAGNISIEYEHNWNSSLPEVAQCVGYLRAWSKLNA